jgi:multidrug resistance efflux pump
MKKYVILYSSLFCLLSCGKKEEKGSTPPPVPSKVEANQVVGIASVEPVGRVLSITSEVNGVVDHIYYSSGQKVKKGQIIFTLESGVERAQLEQAQSKLATQRAMISSQKSSKESLKVKLAQAKTTFERNQKMFEGGAVTQQVLDDSRSNFESLQQDLLTSENNIAQQEARWNELQQDIQYSRTLLDRKSIRADVEGTILNLDLKIGSIVNSNSSLGDFAPEGPYMAITEIDELFAHRVKLGEPAYVRLQGSKDTLTLGKVIFVSPYLKKKSLFSDRPDNLEDRRVREVRVQLDDKSKVLIGSRLECVIKL